MDYEGKKEIRKKNLEIRGKMSEDEANELSDEIVSTLIKLPIFKNSTNVMLYLSFNKEVDTFRLIEHCYKQGKRVIVPYCVKEGTRIIPTELKNVKEDLVKSKFGYMEPKRELIKPFDIESIDLIVIPGISFDTRCFRIGFGAGYYDRFLGKLGHKIPTVGIAYDFQIINLVPDEYFDVPLDYVITEKRIIVR